MAPGRQSGCTQSGFTLLEMIIVILVLGLALGIVVSRGSLHSATVDARSATTRVLQGLRATRAQAIAGGQPLVFSLDAPRHAYRIGAGPPQPLPPLVALAIKPARGIVFLPDGSSAGGQVTLGEADRRLAVQVDWLSGRIRANALK